MQRIHFEHDSSRYLDKLEPVERQLDERIAEFESDLIQIRRHLHSHPEPSGEEQQTTRYLADRLRSLGLAPHMCHDDIGLFVDLDVGNPTEHSPLVAVRADIDALRLTDRKTVDYASRHEGLAHACGHDAHSAMVYGSARVLSEFNGNGPNSPCARVRFIFQPAEEICQGAHLMIKQGALEHVDAILGIHLEPRRPVGTIGIRYGTMTAHCDEVRIRVEGRGGHAARPHHSSDPVAAAGYLVTSLYSLLPRSVDACKAAVFTIGRIEGGHASNVIPDRVELHGSLRTTDTESRGILHRQMYNICANVGASTGNRIDVQFCNALSAVRNDRLITAYVERASRRVVGDERVERITQPSMGGEDFSVYQEQVRGCQFRLGCAGSDDWPPLHSPLFDIDERVLALGSRILARAALLLSVSATRRTAPSSDDGLLPETKVHSGPCTDD